MGQEWPPCKGLESRRWQGRSTPQRVHQLHTQGDEPGQVKFKSQRHLRPERPPGRLSGSRETPSPADGSAGDREAGVVPGVRVSIPLRGMSVSPSPPPPHAGTDSEIDVGQAKPAGGKQLGGQRGVGAGLPGDVSPVLLPFCPSPRHSPGARGPQPRRTPRHRRLRGRAARRRRGRPSPSRGRRPALLPRPRLRGPGRFLPRLPGRTRPGGHSEAPSLLPRGPIPASPALLCAQLAGSPPPRRGPGPCAPPLARLRLGDPAGAPRRAIRPGRPGRGRQRSHLAGGRRARRALCSLAPGSERDLESR